MSSDPKFMMQYPDGSPATEEDDFTNLGWQSVASRFHGADKSGNRIATGQIRETWEAVKEQAQSEGSAVMHFPPGYGYKVDDTLDFELDGSAPCEVLIHFAPGTRIFPTAALNGLDGGGVNPKAAVKLSTRANDDGFLNKLTVKGMVIDGAATSGATGLVNGDNAAHFSGNVHVRDVKIIRFLGANALGGVIADTQQDTYSRWYIGRCTKGLVTRPTAVNLPTTQELYKCIVRECTGRGVELTQAFGVDFIRNTFESNGAEGFAGVSGASQTLLGINLIGGWIENNWLGNSPTNKYQMLVDGAALGSSAMVNQEKVYFNASGRSARYNAATNFAIRSPIPGGLFLIEANCAYGEITGWPEGTHPMATYLSNLSTLVQVQRTNLARSFQGNLGTLADASYALQVGLYAPSQHYAVDLTIPRTLTFLNTNAVPGDFFDIFQPRTSGAGTLAVNGAAAHPAATKGFWRVKFDGAAWKTEIYHLTP